MTEDTTAAIRGVVGKCRAQLDEELCDLVEELGPKLAATARDQAALTKEAATRVASLNLSFSIQDRWKLLLPPLQAALAQRAEAAAKPGHDHREPDTLLILSDGETTVQLAVREALDRVTAACREESGDLERRIAHLVLRGVLAQGDGAFKVSNLFASIEAACARVFPEPEQRTLLIELLGKQLAEELPQLYRSINEALIDADILPGLKRSYREAPPMDPGVAAAEAARMSSALDRLVKARGGSAGQKEASAPGGVSAEFLHSLKTLKPAPAATPGTHTNVVKLARDSEAARKVSPQEAVALDIVAELFDHVFGDQNVAEGVKALVARLQTPVLRLAMANQRFFADRGHPARLFLNAISDIAVRWGKFANAQDPVYRKLSELIDHLADTFDGDIKAFEDANHALAEFLTRQEAAEAEESRALAEAVRVREEEIRIQREGQLRAQKAADAAINPLLKGDMPPAIEQFLVSYWRDVVQGRIFASGPESVPVAEALTVASELIWSVVPKHTAEDRKKQAASAPFLLKRLNAGFDEVAASPAERGAFMDALVELQLAALRADRRPATKTSVKEAVAKAANRPPAPKAAPTLQVSHTTGTGVRVQDISLAEGTGLSAEDTPDRGHLRNVRQLVRGDWVDFITAGQSRRERLTWINPSRTLLLFSNSASACAISITPEALAVRLKNQTAKLVKRETPMFERALDGAVRSLDKQA